MEYKKFCLKKNTVKTLELNTSSLSKGVFVLQMTDKEGNSTSSKFVKE